jgi:hypothetical protein
MNLNDDVVDRCLRLGPLRQRHPGGSGSLVRYHDRFHLDTPLCSPRLCRTLGQRTAPRRLTRLACADAGGEERSVWDIRAGLSAKRD